MVLASVKLSMPGASAPGSIAQVERRSSRRRRPTRKGSAIAFSSEQEPSCDGKLENSKSDPPTMKPGPSYRSPATAAPESARSEASLRIKLSVKDIMSQVGSQQASGAATAASARSDQAVCSAMIPPVPVDNSLAWGRTSLLRDDYRSLIHRHMRRSADDDNRPGAWICRHCGAERKEVKRGAAAVSNLLSHLRACVRLDLAAEDIISPLKINSTGAVKRKVSLQQQDDDDDDSISPVAGIVPNMLVDVCFGATACHGYRLLKESVKNVRMSIHEENWEDVAVSQTLEDFRLRSKEPGGRFLIRSDDGGSWREASDHDVRRKIVALYRHYFSFRTAKDRGAVEVHEPEIPFFLQQLERANLQASLDGSELHSGTDLDSGIIRHVLIQGEDLPGASVGDKRAESASSRMYESEIDQSPEPQEKRARRGPEALHAPFPERPDSPIDDAVLASSVCQAVRSSIAAKWYTFEQEREQRAVLLEQRVHELRDCTRAVADKKAAVTSARKQYLDLASGSGVDTDPLISEAKTKGPAVADAAGTGEVEAAHDELSSRIERRLCLLKAESSELDRMLSWWHSQTDALKKLLDTEDEPTPEFLRAEVRVAELESQIEAMLKD